MKFQLVKTVSYELSAQVEIPEATSPEEALAILDRESDAWVEWEQLDGNNETLDAYHIWKDGKVL